MSEHFEAVKQALKEHYALQRELGSGGMATVYLAEDIKHSRKVAVKVLRPELVALLGTQRFLKEIEIAATLQHPHILPLHDSGEAGGFLFYVMPFVEGESLRDKLEREGKLPWREAIAIAREVAGALDYAHNQDLVHRDIKPENILLSQGHAVVADFGIAAAMSSSDESRATQMGFALGTPAYMSPEQAATDPDLDGRADIYSLGCVLFEMITGNPPFHGTNAQEVLAQSAIADAPELNRESAGAVPRGIERAIAIALEKEPAKRFATALEFCDALVPTSGVNLTPINASGVFAVLSMALLGVVYFVTVQLGLPYWALVSLGIVAVLGLPIVAQTARVEQGVRDVIGGGFLSWRRTVRAGVTATVAIAAALAGDVGMRLAGIGPAGALLAAGVLEERERIILADFVDRSGDSTLAAVVTEAFRIDFSQSPVVTVVETGFIRQTLARMEVPARGVLDPETAHEVAIRAGIKAVMTGEIGAIGSGYVLSARLVSAETREVLAAFRENASGPEQVVDAIDRLSRRMRERIGESLRSIRSNEPLSEVTTTSLDALRKYSQGIRAADQGEILTARTLMAEAIELDSSFAMAYRYLGIMSLGRSEQVEMLTRAFEFRDRLTERERYLAEGTYYQVVTDETDAAIVAYQALLATYPDDWRGLNNLATLYQGLGDNSGAARLLTRVVELDSRRPAGYAGLIQAQVGMGDRVAATGTLEEFASRFPDHPAPRTIASTFLAGAGLHDSAMAVLDTLLARQPGNIAVQINGRAQRALLAYSRGRLDEGDRHLSESLELMERLNLAAASLNSTIVRAIVASWFRGDASVGLREIPAALERFPMQEIEPLDRPYLTLAQFYALTDRPEDARAMLASFENEIDPDLRRVLEEARHTILGLIALADDRPGEAVAEFRLGETSACPICSLPFIGMAYDRAGNPDSTIAVYRRFLDTPWLGRIAVDWTWRGRILFRLGQLHDERGDVRDATEYYAQLVELWSEADPELQPVVADARAALARLAAER